MIRRNNKRALYESIMRDVAKTIKHHLNESSNNFNIKNKFNNSKLKEFFDISDIKTSQNQLTARLFPKTDEVLNYMLSFNGNIYGDEPHIRISYDSNYKFEAYFGSFSKSSYLNGPEFLDGKYLCRNVSTLEELFENIYSELSLYEIDDNLEEEDDDEEYYEDDEDEYDDDINNGFEFYIKKIKQIIPLEEIETNTFNFVNTFKTLKKQINFPKNIASYIKTYIKTNFFTYTNFTIPAQGNINFSSRLSIDNISKYLTYYKENNLNPIIIFKPTFTKDLGKKTNIDLYNLLNDYDVINKLTIESDAEHIFDDILDAYEDFIDYLNQNL